MENTFFSSKKIKIFILGMFCLSLIFQVLVFTLCSIIEIHTNTFLIFQVLPFVIYFFCVRHILKSNFKSNTKIIFFSLLYLFLFIFFVAWPLGIYKQMIIRYFRTITEYHWVFYKYIKSVYDFLSTILLLTFGYNIYAHIRKSKSISKIVCIA